MIALLYLEKKTYWFWCPERKHREDLADLLDLSRLSRKGKGLEVQVLDRERKASWRALELCRITQLSFLVAKY